MLFKKSLVLVVGFLLCSLAKADIDSFESAAEAYESAKDLTESLEASGGFICTQYTQDNPTEGVEYKSYQYIGQWYMECHRHHSNTKHKVVARNNRIVGDNALLGAPSLNFRVLDDKRLAIQHVSRGQEGEAVLAYSVCSSYKTRIAVCF